MLANATLPPSLTYLWLICFAFFFAFVVLSVANRLLRRTGILGSIACACSKISLPLCCLVIAGAVRSLVSQEVLDEQFILVPALAIVVVAMLAPVGCGLKATVLPLVQHRYASVLIPALAMGGSWFQFEASLVNPEPFSESLLGLGEAEVVTEVAAITDEGRIVALVRYPSESVAQASLVVPKAIRSNLVRSAAADSRYNCHGWVFTAGKFLVRGADVDQILADNHYQPVSAPRANDVVVYRTPQGHVCHTGLVRSVDDHEVVVESKWGLGPRFVHRVQDQTYSNQFDYYRANRESHVLRFDAVRHETQTAVHNRVDELVAEKPRHSSG